MRFSGVRIPLAGRRAASMDELASKSIPPVPELADRAPFSLVINSLLVRAADDAVARHDRQHTMRHDEFQDLLRDGWVGTNVANFDLPVAQLLGFRMLGWHHAHNNLGGLAQVRTVECDCCNGPTPHALPGLLSHPFQKSILHRLAPKDLL